MRETSQSAKPTTATGGGEAAITPESSYASPQAPAVTLPKVGGAICGIGEKFAANPVTGTGAMTVPIAISPERSGCGPQLSLSYDSGAANGYFGFGWSLSLPQITRKTDKELPQYFDAQNTDVFFLSGAENLMPVLVQDTQGTWERESLPARIANGATYRVNRYRPRIEGLFARNERWTNTADTLRESDGGQNPHLLIKTINNLGTETRTDYAPSTKFYSRRADF